jgi:serine/threonine protein kinase
MAEVGQASADSSSDPWIGRVLGGRYRVVARIGGGGMGVVYRAWDDHVDGYVVVKIPRQELTGDPKFLMRFEQELTALRFLSHSTVVPIVDVGSDQGMPYAVMPYLAGGSLKQRRPITKDGGIAAAEPASLWQWLPAIARALDFVHASGYVHRDVKPDNILFDGLGSPYLGDFGVAKIVLQSENAEASRGLTGTGFTLGTPEYMAPELISAVKPGPPVDQYALAVMTYEMLAGRRPFDGPTPAAVLVAHATATAPALTTVRGNLPEAVGQAIARGMAKDPGARFESCELFARHVLSAVPQPPPVEKLQLMCPRCGRMLNVKPDWAGKHGTCPRCKTALKIGVDLRSLWVPGDRTGTATPSEAIAISQFSGGTPSLPVRVSSARTAIQNEALRQMTREQTVFGVLKEQFARSIVLQCLAAVVVAFAFLGITMIAFRGEKRTRAVAVKPEQRPMPSQPSGKEKKDKPPAEPVHERQVEPELNAVPGLPPDPQPATADVAKDEASAIRVAEPVDAVQPAESPDVEKQPRRLPVPAVGDIEDATSLVRQAYEELYSQSASQKSYGTLVDQLVESAERTEDPVRRYALLLEAERLCEPELMLSQAIELVSERSRQYDEDLSAAERAVLERFSKADDNGSEELFAAAMDLGESRMRGGNFEVAEAAASLAVNVARAMGGGRKDGEARDKLKAADALQAKVQDAKKMFEIYKAALLAIEASPDDAAAHAAIGRYLCFAQKSWDKGLDHLARGGLGKLSEVAAKQRAIDGRGRTDPQEVFLVAGDWWALAEGEGDLLSARERTAIKSFASALYRSVVGKLADGLDVKIAENRIKDVPPDEPIVSQGPFPGRTNPRLRQRLVAAGGGTPQSEAAVDAALKWFIQHQMPDGGWSFDLNQCPSCRGQCSHSGAAGNTADRCGATALSLLPFLGRGYTHKVGPYKKQLLAGINYLVELTVQGQGKAYGEGASMYSQGVAGIVLAESFALTQDKRLAMPAQLALNFIMAAQDPVGGGWRYSPKQPGDTSAFGWQLMALASGHMAQLQVAPLTIKKADGFLDRVQADDGAAYGYTDPGAGSATSAVGLLCRMYLGWKKDHPALQRGVERLAQRGPSSDLYFDYYANQVMHHMSGDRWIAWNEKMRNMLVDGQAKQGHEEGSWYDRVSSGQGPHVGGRIYCTSLATMILEVYYRHPRLYGEDAAGADVSATTSSTTPSAAGAGESDDDASSHAGRIYLSDLPTVTGTTGHYSFEKGRLTGWSVNGVTPQKGLFAHAPSAVHCSLAPRGVATLQGSVGLGRANENSRCRFTIFGDDRKLWESGIIVQGEIPGRSVTEDFVVDVTNVRNLTLVVDPLGSIDSDHSIWIDPMILQGRPR